MDVEAPVLREEVLNQPSLKECFLFLFTFFFDYDCAVFAFYFYSLFSLIIVLTFALLAYILCSCSYKIQENPYLVGHVEKSVGECASHHRLLLLQSEHEKHCSIF